MLVLRSRNRGVAATGWLSWVGLGWVGLGWVGLGWVGLGWGEVEVVQYHHKKHGDHTGWRAKRIRYTCYRNFHYDIHY